MKSVYYVLLAALTIANAENITSTADYLDSFIHKFGKEIEKIIVDRVTYKLEKDIKRAHQLAICTHCVDQNSRNFQATCQGACRDTLQRVVEEHNSGNVSVDDYKITQKCLECLTRKANDRNRYGCSGFCRTRDMERVLKSLLVKTDRNNRYDYDEGFNNNENVKNAFFPYNVNYLTDF